MSSASTADSQDDVSTGLELGAVAIAVILSVLLSFLEHNNKGKRPGIVIPMNFIQDDRLAFVYSAAFGCTAFQLLILIFNRDTLSPNIPKLVYPWIRVLVWLFMAFLVAVKYYPLFAVIRCKRAILEPLIGLLYTAYIFTSFMYQLIDLLSTAKSGAKAGWIIAYLPIIVCYLVMLGYFIYKLFRHCQNYCKGHDHLIETLNRCCTHHQRDYVKWLLRKPEKYQDCIAGNIRSFDACVKRVKNKLEISTPLRASPRVIATFIVAAITIYQVAIVAVTLYALLRPGTDNLRNSLSTQSNTNASVIVDSSIISTFLTVSDVGFYLSFSLSAIIIAVYIGVLYVNYRKDLVKLHRGDYSFMPMKLRKTLNDNLVAASLRYAGAQIAYLLWCYLIMLILLYLGCIAIAYMVILPLAKKVPFFFFEPVLTILPIIIINFGFKKLQIILSRRYFLQDHTINIKGKTGIQKSLAIDNVKVFNIVTFFTFFFNVIIGFFSCISRILIGLLIGLVSLARIDRCMLPAGFEKWDKGYSTCVGMIMVELYHRNPILTVFCDELLSSKRGVTSALLEPVKDTERQGSCRETQNQKHRRVCRRWQKAYTIINNPSVKLPVSSEIIHSSLEQVEVVF